MAKDEKALIPPPAFPVPSFNAPAHIEAVKVERIDVSDTGYTKLARGTLYSTVVGAQQTVIDQYPTLYLLREIADPARYPWVYRYWGTGDIFTTKTIGQQNLTPAKYRRLIRTIETDQPVDINYTFPSGLVGDQTQIELAQETIEEARLKIIQEIINTDESPLIGGETSEWGPLAIYESVVDEGTPIDTGFLVLKSSVTPFGNGKAVKITVNYPANLILQHLITRTLGQRNLIPEKYRRLVKQVETVSMVDPATFSFPSILTGDQTEIQYIEETITRARLKILEEVINTDESPLQGVGQDKYAPLTIFESVVDDGTPGEFGFLIKDSQVTPLGNGKSIKITVKYPDDLATRTQQGQTLDRQTGLPITYLERVAPINTEIGDDNKEITPIDFERELVRETDLTPLIGTWYKKLPSWANLDLPNTLVSITGITEPDTGLGTYHVTGTDASVGPRGSISLSAPSNSEGNASIVADVFVNIKEAAWSRNFPTTRYMFVVPQNASVAQILSILTGIAGATVNSWPLFVPQAHVIICFSKSAAVSARTDASLHFSYSATSRSGGSTVGSGGSKKISSSAKAVHIPACIHGTLSLGSDVSRMLTAYADARSFLTSNIGINPDSGLVSITEPVTAYITPTSLSATPGLSAIPSTGLYALPFDSQIFGNVLLIHAEVVDFSLAP